MELYATMYAADYAAERRFRKDSLKSYLMCLGLLNIMSVLVYVGLFFLVTYYSTGTFSNVLRIMTICTVAPSIILGALLIMGALDEKRWALTLALWLSLLLASYTTVLGAMGAIYFIRKAKLTSHFLIACMYTCLGCSVFVVLCHDMIVIHMYRNLLMEPLAADV